MRLKSIDLQGFKSFPDRTKLDFDDGVTVVVGPNGSGKSNIADAMRWVLGEQSTRTLRGGKMEDVIFGGTQTRKAQGVASVTLLMDNTDRSLGIDADEVAVTRRLYRSGDSEYRINGAQVRLKDLTELFMDTGLGRDGYSIIGQGRVSEIVSARSKERREIFEEAAGISKFRYRKTEAERRLELAEENLSRLRDIRAELDARVGPLKIQSEKARQFLELSAQKKTLEVSVWMHTLAGLREKTAVLEDKLLLAQSDFETAERDAAGQETAFAAEQERGRALMVEIEELRAAMARASEQVTGWESQAAVLQNDIGHHQRAIAEAGDAIGQAGRSRGDIEAEIDAKRQFAAARRQEADELGRTSGELEAQMHALEAEQAETAAALEANRLRRAGVFEAIETAKMEAASSATLLTESQSRLGEMGQAEVQRGDAVAAVQNELAECEGLLEEISQSLIALENSSRGYLLKAQSRRQKVETLTESLSGLEREAQERRQRAKLLSDMDKNMEGFGQSVKFIMSQARAGTLQGVYGPISSLIEVDDAHAVALETALGGAMQNLVVENEEVAKRAINLLKNAKAGRATFLPLTSVRGQAMQTAGVAAARGFVGLASELVKCDEKFEGIVRSLLGRVVVSEDLDCAVSIAKQNNYRFRVVTLDGQVVNAGGAMTGGYTVKSAGILGRQGEIDRLNRQVAALEQEMQGIAVKREGAAAELASLDAELAALEAQQRTHKEDRIRAETERRRIEQNLEQAKRQAEEIRIEREALARRIGEMREKSGSSGELIARLSEELDALQADIGAQGARRDEILSRKEQLVARLTEQNTQALLLERDGSAALQEIARLTGLLGSNEQQKQELSEKIAQLEAQIAQEGEQIRTLSEQAAAGRCESEDVQGRVLAKMQERNESERRCTELRAAEREAGARRDGLYREVVRLGEQKNSADSEFSTVVAKLYDEYEMTQSDAEAQAVPIEDLPAANRRLSELRGKIKGLGSVNVGAIEEYSEVALRHETLTRQLADVEDSKAELVRLIGELTSQMCEIFTDKLEQINRHFAQVFHALFEGGTASLSLTDPADVLESGIEIAVRPPGKVVKNLAALSGGEQSFVAIAIFFAILKVNPAPFCLMDEIEAALDDVNVSKFATYLHSMTDKTQFIVITHRRGTMEEADVLYGVTMQEKGVSKLLELKVSELEASVE